MIAMQARVTQHLCHMIAMQVLRMLKWDGQLARKLGSVILHRHCNVSAVGVTGGAYLGAVPKWPVSWGVPLHARQLHLRATESEGSVATQCVGACSKEQMSCASEKRSQAKLVHVIRHGKAQPIEKKSLKTVAILDQTK